MNNTKDKLVEFECIIENLIFPRNISEAENNFKIYAVEVDKLKHPDIKFTKYGNATIIGDLHELGIGARYKVKATEQNTPRGYSYKVQNIGRNKPTDELTSRLFLYEILTQGQADVLMDVYPDIINKVINNDLSDVDLSKTKGIKEYTFEVIKRKIEENFVFAEIINLFDGLLDLSILKKLYDKYPSSILIKEAIETKPYQTLCGISRVAFKTADSILLLFEKELKEFIKNGNEPKIKFISNDLRSSIDRCYGAVEHLLLENSSNGNTKMGLVKLKKEIECLTPECCMYLKDVIKYDEFYIDKETKSIALRSSYEAELKISNILKHMLSHDSNMNISEEEILSYKKFDGFELTNAQINALINLIKYSVSALVGVAGCVDNETEYFNGYGWKKISEYTEGDMVLQANEDRSAELVFPIEYHKYKEDVMYEMKNDSETIDQVLSYNHNIAYITSRGNLKKEPFHKVINSHNNSKGGVRRSILNAFEYAGGSGINMSNEEIRLSIAIMADGHFNNNTNSCRVNIKKDRKKDRLKILLDACNIEYKIHKWNPKDPDFDNFVFQAPIREKNFPIEWYNASKEQLEIIYDEILFWDGYTDKHGRRSYFSTHKSDVDFIQFVCSALGYTSNIMIDDRVGQPQKSSNGKTYVRKNICYSVHISKNKWRFSSMMSRRGKTKKIVPYTNHDGYKYCFTVPSGYLVLRRNNKIFVTGNSGKSMSTKPIIKFMDDHNMTYKILAPTGRASKVISAYTNKIAYTIHRGLGFKGYWEYNEENKLDVDVIIIDESSMQDIHLALRVLEATQQDKTKILFIGDNEQLPSVGEGNFLHDIIHSKVIPTTMLTEVFRYGSGGMLTVATDIREGKEFIYSNNSINKFGEDESYVYIPTSQQKIKNTMIAIYKKLIKSGKSPIDIMVLTAYNKGEYGTIQINKELQPIANDNYGSDVVATVGDINKVNYYIGDIVIQHTNNYKAEIHMKNDEQSFFNDNPPTCFISNGDIGIIKDIISSSEGIKVVIQFDDFLVSYHKTQLISNISLAYSISLHKSQGGSVDTAILLIPKAHTFMLNSNLLYVGSTRARDRVYCIGEPTTINRAIKKKANFERETFLKELLKKG